jgi:ABC-type uncharacterized transport system ATPase subunit
MTTTATAAPPVLAATDVSVHFGGLKALQNVSVSIPEGAIIGLLGPNGAGKSTLLGVLSGDVAATHGTVRLSGKSITGLAPQVRVRRGLARTFQQPEVFGKLTPREHLLLADRLAGRPSRAWSDPFTGRFLSNDSDADVDALLENLGLTDVANVPIAALPLGVSRLWRSGVPLRPGRRLFCSTNHSPDSTRPSRTHFPARSRASARQEASPWCSSSTTWRWYSSCPNGSMCWTSAS